MKYSNVKLTVTFSKVFPFELLAKDASGNVAQVRCLPNFSTDNKSVKDIFLDKTLQKGQKEACEVALADFLLRSKSNQMWDLIVKLHACVAQEDPSNLSDCESEACKLVQETLEEYEALLKGVYGK